MPKDAPLAVEVPASGRDNPGWVKVGVIAAVGFIIGIAWPRLMGIRLGPAAPGGVASAGPASASGSAHAGRAPDAPPASVAAKAPVVTTKTTIGSSATPAAAPAPLGVPTVTVRKGAVLSCKTTSGETKKGTDCGPVPGIDQLVQPRLRKISSCDGAEGQTGKLSFVVNVDFHAGRFSYDVGKSSTLPKIDALASCLKTTFHGTSTAAIPHEHPRYTVAYSAIFASAASGDEDNVASTIERSEKGDKDTSEKAAKSASEPPEVKKREKPDLASGEAQVAWEVALVRDAPKTGGLVSRLPRGTTVKVGPARDGWFQIKFGEGHANEGWVYRGAIGR